MATWRASSQRVDRLVARGAPSLVFADHLLDDRRLFASESVCGTQLTDAQRQAGAVDDPVRHMQRERVNAAGRRLVGDRDLPDEDGSPRVVGLIGSRGIGGGSGAVAAPSEAHEGLLRGSS